MEWFVYNDNRQVGEVTSSFVIMCWFGTSQSKPQYRIGLSVTVHNIYVLLMNAYVMSKDKTEIG